MGIEGSAALRSRGFRRRREGMRKRIGRTTRSTNRKANHRQRETRARTNKSERTGKTRASASICQGRLGIARSLTHPQGRTLYDGPYAVTEAHLNYAYTIVTPAGIRLYTMRWNQSISCLYARRRTNFEFMVRFVETVRAGERRSFVLSN